MSRGIMDLVEVKHDVFSDVRGINDDTRTPDDPILQVLELNEHLELENLTDLLIANSSTMTNELLMTIYMNRGNITNIKIINCPNISEEFFHRVAHHEMSLTGQRQLYWTSLHLTLHFAECPMIPVNLIRSLKSDDDTIFFANQITIDNVIWLVDPVIYITNSDYLRYKRDYADDPLMFLETFFDIDNVQKNFPLEINKSVTMVECRDTARSKWMTKRQHDSLSYFYTAMKWHQPKSYFQTDPDIHPDTFKFLAQITQVTDFYQHINTFDFINFENAFYDYYKLYMHRNYFHFFPRYNRLFNKKHFNLYEFLLNEPNFEFPIQLDQFYELMKRFGRKINEIIIDRDSFDYKAYNTRVIFILIAIIKRFCKRIKIIKIESLIFVNNRSIYKTRGEFYRTILHDIEYKRKLRVRFLYTNSSMIIGNGFSSTDFLVNLNLNFSLLQKLDLVRCTKILEPQHFFIVLRLPILLILYLNCDYRNFNDWNFLHIDLPPTNSDVLVPQLKYLQIFNKKNRQYDHIDNLLRNLSRLNRNRIIQLRYLELNNCYLNENDIFSNYDINYLCLKNCASLSLVKLKSLHQSGHNLWNLQLEDCDLLNDTVLFEAVKIYKNILWMKIIRCSISDVFIYKFVEYEMLCRNVQTLKWKYLNKIFIFEDCYISGVFVKALYDKCAKFQINMSDELICLANEVELRQKYSENATWNSLEAESDKNDSD